MRSYDNAAAILAAPGDGTDQSLHELLAARVHDWHDAGLLDFTHLSIVEAEDTESDIVEAIGFSPLVSAEGLRSGAMGFVPNFDWVEDHGGWFELIMTVGNDGFAFALLVKDQEGVVPELLALCRTYAVA